MTTIAHLVGWTQPAIIKVVLTFYFFNSYSMCQSSCGGGCASKRKMKKLFIGGMLLVVGILFLLKNYNVLPNLMWSDVWPWLAVIAGLKMVVCCCKKGNCGDKKDGAMTEEKDGCCGAGETDGKCCK